MVAAPMLAAASDEGGNVCKPPGPSSSSSSSYPSTSCAGSVTLLYASEVSSFGWREGLVAGEFAKQLRIAVLHVTGLPSLEGVELVLEQDATVTSPGPASGQRVTPRDLFQGRFFDGSGSVPRVRALPPARLTVTPSAEPVKGVLGSVTTATVSGSALPPVRKLAPPQALDQALPQAQPQTRAVAKSKYAKSEKSGGSQLQFMQLVAANKNPKAVIAEGSKLTVAEVARHRRNGDCWTIYQGKVYDITLYLDFHPGSKKELMKGAGKDCTELYNQVHPWVSIDGLLGNLCLGSVVPTAPPAEEEEDDGTGEVTTVPEPTKDPSSAAEDRAHSVTDSAVPSSEVRGAAGYPAEL